MGNTLASNNHTTQYLILSSDTSVQLNMRIDPGYINGILEMTPRSYVESNSEILHFSLRVNEAFTPRMLHDWLVQVGFQDYTFTGGGIGCRYWKWVLLQQILWRILLNFVSILVIYLLERYQRLPWGSAVQIHARLPFSFSTNRNPVPWPIQQGTFDRPGTQAIATQLCAEISAQVQENIRHLRQADANAQEMTAATSQLQALQTSATQGARLAQEREGEGEEGESSEDEE